MLRRLNQLTGFKIAATDDQIGSVQDFYFDDHTWTVRYMVVDTGPWILGRQVLIPAAAIETVNWEGSTISLPLTTEQVKNSPDISLEQPVSRQHEIALHEHYGWPGYWYAAPAMASPMGGMYAVPVPPESVVDPLTEDEMPDAPEEQGDPHLRSVKEVVGYDIQATDGSIGHVEDFFAGENEWRIRYLLVDTRNWLPGRKVLIGVDWAERIDWSERDVIVNVTREKVQDSPEYDPQAPLSRHYEENLHNYYHLSGYWF